MVPNYDKAKPQTPNNLAPLVLEAVAALHAKVAPLREPKAPTGSLFPEIRLLEPARC